MGFLLLLLVLWIVIALAVVILVEVLLSVLMCCPLHCYRTHNRIKEHPSGIATNVNSILLEAG